MQLSAIEILVCIEMELGCDLQKSKMTFVYNLNTYVLMSVEDTEISLEKILMIL